MRLMLAAICLALGSAVSTAFAATQAPFTQPAFEAAQSSGKPVLVAVHASWCPVCAKQRPIMEKLAADPAFKDLTILVVDFDTQKDVVKAFGVQKQSTLISFHGTVETDRSTGATDEDAIRALFAKASS